MLPALPRVAPSLAARADGTEHRRLRRLAAVDLGTNNCRLLVAEVGDGDFRPLRGEQRLVRLGAGVATRGRLASDAVARTLEVLRAYDGIARELGVEERRGVITEVARRARDGEAFLAQARACGWPLELAGPAREAWLTLLACRPLLARVRGPALVVDIGGGSSELLWVEPEAATVPAVSLPFGAVVLREQLGEASDPAVFAATVARVRHALARVPFTPPADGVALAVGTSGTATVLAGLALGLERPQRAAIDGAVVTPARLREVRRQVASWPLQVRQAHPLIGPGRADVLLSGAAILEAVLEHFGCRRFMAADRGPLEGLVREAAGQQAPPVALVPIEGERS